MAKKTEDALLVVLSLCLRRAAVLREDSLRFNEVEQRDENRRGLIDALLDEREEIERAPHELVARGGGKSETYIEREWTSFTASFEISRSSSSLSSLESRPSLCWDMRFSA